MFWGLVLEPSKKYTQKVEQTFHISQAALDLQSCDMEPIKIVVEYENSNFVLATLSKRVHIYQVPLDLIFKTGDEVSFRTIGNGKVHLSGYHVLEDVDSMIMNGEEESDIEELEEIVKGRGKRKKLSPNTKEGKKAKLEKANADESEDDDFDEKDEYLDEEERNLDEEDEDSENEDKEQNISVGKKTQQKKQKNNSLLSMDDDDNDDDDYEYDEYDDEEEEEEEDEEEDEDEEDEEETDLFEIGDESDEFSSLELGDLKKGKMSKSASKKSLQTPNGVASSSKKKVTPVQKLNKGQKEGTPGKGGKTPKSENKQTNEKKSGSLENTPQRKNLESSKKEEKTPQRKNLESYNKEEKTSKSPKTKDSPQKKVLEGGVISEEIKVGNGPAAKPGKMANVYYVGILASTKKEFDSVQSGGGFKFRIGRNEVIKGWDIGINGMKVGGKRRLTIPPHLAYGSKGSPPVIPPNSTLVFTVELRGLS